jgi:hypothetical protein
MRIADIIYFAPGLRIDQIDFDNRENLIEAFSIRIREYYLKPIEILLDHQNSSHAFSVGVLTVTAMDAIAYYSIENNGDFNNGMNRIRRLLNEITDFGQFEQDREEITRIFTSKFRNGLIHEGRIKSGHQFSFCYNSLFMREGNFLIVDPQILFLRLNQYFDWYVEKLKSDDYAYKQFSDRIAYQFKSEIKKLLEQNSN